MSRLDRRVLLVVAVIAVVLGAAEAQRRRGRRPSPPEIEVHAAPPAVRPPDAPILAATDDLDDAGAGLPVPAAQAVEELRAETRFETQVFVRAVLILIVIAALLAARAVWV